MEDELIWQDITHCTVQCDQCILVYILCRRVTLLQWSPNGFHTISRKDCHCIWICKYITASYFASPLRRWFLVTSILGTLRSTVMRRFWICFPLDDLHVSPMIQRHRNHRIGNIRQGLSVPTTTCQKHDLPTWLTKYFLAARKRLSVCLVLYLVAPSITPTQKRVKFKTAHQWRCMEP